MIKIIIADNQKLLRESLKYMIENNTDMHVVACAADGEEVIRYCTEIQPHVVLIDIEIPIYNGIQAAKIIKARYPSIKILILTSSSDEKNVCSAMANGADGYIMKNIGAKELIHCINSTLLGFQIVQRDLLKNILFFCNENDFKKVVTIDGVTVTLKERDLKIIQMIVDGYSNQDIAKALFVAEGTAKNLITEIIAKVQLKDRTQLAVYAIKNNLVLTK
ncbi:MAG: response regulator [Eubacteriales bacterium]